MMYDLQIIQFLAYQRRQIVRAQNRLLLQIQAICRGVCDGDKTEGRKVYAALVKGSIYGPSIKANLTTRHLFEALKPLDIARKDIEKQLTAEAKLLPVYPWVKENVRGMEALSLAKIIGEAGDLSQYANKGKLWKRMGIALVDGIRQGGLNSKTATKEDWIRHGYNPGRRSDLFVVGDSILKAQIRKVKDAAGEDTGERTSIGPYGEIYLKRKAYELARDSEMTPMHAHRRAQRYMEQRLLKHLWQAWRRSRMKVPETASASLTVAPQFLVAAE